MRVIDSVALRYRSNLRRGVYAFLIVSCVLLLCSASRAAGAAYEGFGSQTPGGSGGEIVRVTNLNDAGPGSLREALAGGNRSVVFDVAGDIVLTREIRMLHPFVTVDGTTAPLPGITLKNYGLVLHGSPRYYPGADAHDIIIRNIRVRDAYGDGIQVAWDASNIVLDRVSVGNSGDGNIDVTHGAHNVTISRSILGGFKNNMLIKSVSEGRETRRVSVHHSLLAETMNLALATPAVRQRIRPPTSGTTW
jgi:pectate lyase